MTHALDRGLVVRLQHSVHGDPFIVEEAIRRFGRRGRAAGLGNIGLRAGEERRAEIEQPRRQPGIAEFGATELAMHPASRGWRAPWAQTLQRGGRQCIDKHPFGGRFGVVRSGLIVRRFIVTILAPATRGQAEFGPVGGAIAGAGVSAFDAGFHQPGVKTVTVPPILPDPPRQLTQDMGRQMLHTHPGQDQEAAVADDALQVFRPFGVGPTEPDIAGPQPPGGGGDRQPTQRAVVFADDQVPDLRPAQRAIALRVMRPHHHVPRAAGLGAAGHGAQADSTQTGQRAADVRPDRDVPGRRPPRWRLVSGFRQRDIAPALPRQKLLAAGHLPRAALRIAQVQPGAEILRQSGARQSGLPVDMGAQPGERVRRTEGRIGYDRFHAIDATSDHSLCPEVDVGKDQGITRGRRQGGRHPARPWRRNRTAARKTTPSTKRGRSVSSVPASWIAVSANAPRIGPCRAPMPPSRIIKSAAAERCHPSRSGLTNASVSADMCPARPASAPASTNAISFRRGTL